MAAADALVGARAGERHDALGAGSGARPGVGCCDPARRRPAGPPNQIDARAPGRPRSDFIRAPRSRACGGEPRGDARPPAPASSGQGSTASRSRQAMRQGGRDALAAARQAARTADRRRPPARQHARRWRRCGRSGPGTGWRLKPSSAPVRCSTSTTSRRAARPARVAKATTAARGAGDQQAKTADAGPAHHARRRGWMSADPHAVVVDHGVQPWALQRAGRAPRRCAGPAPVEAHGHQPRHRQVVEIGDHVARARADQGVGLLLFQAPGLGHAGDAGQGLGGAGGGGVRRLAALGADDHRGLARRAGRSSRRRRGRRPARPAAVRQARKQSTATTKISGRRGRRWSGRNGRGPPAGGIERALAHGRRPLGRVSRPASRGAAPAGRERATRSWSWVAMMTVVPSRFSSTNRR